VTGTTGGTGSTGATGSTGSTGTTGATGADGTNGYIGYVRLEDQKAANTQGGTATSGSWQKRTLNTEVTDTNGDCSLSSSQITLTAGTYDCLIIAPAAACDMHKARLQNVTDATTVIVGTSELAQFGFGAASSSVVRGRFTIAASKALEVQHQVFTTSTTQGFGVASNFGVIEVYTVAEFWRVS